jgi:hypothetical protein
MELILRQVLIIPDVPLFETCVISEPKPLPPTSTTVTPVYGSNKPELEPEPEVDSDPEMESNSKDYLGCNDDTNNDLETSQKEQEPEREIKHFGFTEVEIDFDNIPDTIDTNEPNFPNTTTKSESNIAHSKEATTMIASIKLKKHKDVLYDMYKVAKKKAQEAKKVAIRTYLEAKEIKAAYLLDNSDLSDSDDDV